MPGYGHGTSAYSRLLGGLFLRLKYKMNFVGYSFKGQHIMVNYIDTQGGFNPVMQY